MSSQCYYNVIRKMVTLPSDHFFYFAYGSNLLKKRLQLNNPSAEFIGIGRLDGHQLDFNKYGDRWKGAAATIVPVSECTCQSCDRLHVWGAIWRLHVKDLPALDLQEGVESNFYFPKKVTIIMANEHLECRTYEQTSVPKALCGKWDLPTERKPSKTYLKCIIHGATECKLPIEYINHLKLIPDNGKEAPEMEAKLF